MESNVNRYDDFLGTLIKTKDLKNMTFYIILTKLKGVPLLQNH